MLKAVFALLGDDTVRIRDAAARLADEALEEAYRSFNFQQFAPGDASPAEIEEAALAYPFGEGRRVIVIRELGSFHPDHQEALAEMAARFADDAGSASTLIFIAPGLDRRRRPFKILNSLGEHPCGEAMMFEAPPPWKMDRWVAERASERGILLGRGAAQALADLVGENLLQLDGELTKLELYAGRGNRVEVETVERVVGRRRDETPWEVPRMLFMGEGGGAQRLVGRLLAAGERPEQLLNVLTRHVLESYRVRLLLDGGADQDAIMRELGMKPWQAKKAVAAARQVSAHHYPRMLAALKECDRGMKTRSGQKADLLQRAVGELAARAAGARRNATEG